MMIISGRRVTTTRVIMKMSIRATRVTTVMKNITDTMRTTARKVVTMMESTGVTIKVTDTKFFNCHLVAIAIFFMPIVYSLKDVM
jgi:hypothetical protein